MELKVDIGFEQLVHAIKQLPAAKILQLKEELAEKKLPNKHTEPTDFRDLLLHGPVMNDKQYENFKEIRSRFDKWRTK